MSPAVLCPKEGRGDTQEGQEKPREGRGGPWVRRQVPVKLCSEHEQPTHRGREAELRVGQNKEVR